MGMGTTASTANPTTAGKSPKRISLPPAPSNEQPISTMSLTFGSQIRDDLSHESLMGLQELDTHLSLLDDTKSLSPKDQTPNTVPTSRIANKADSDIQSSIETSTEEVLVTKSFLSVNTPALSPNPQGRPRKIPKTAKKFQRDRLSESVQSSKAERATDSIASSMLTAQSEVSSVHSPMSSKATPPTDVDSHAGEVSKKKSPKPSPALPVSDTRQKYEVRPKASIPADLAPDEYARQCVAAAESSRLQPFSMHPEEHDLMRKHIDQAHVTTYLNIRNGILRLWVRNPLIGVMRDEAIGCARDARWFDAANVCYEWLVRRGYINYGCLENVDSRGSAKRGRPGKRKGKMVVILGAGMAGLGAARQLEGLFAHFADDFCAKGEDPPKVMVFEGRDRIGGRVYSHGLKTKPGRTTSLAPGARATAEMGGMIITGFDRGNPLNIIVRGQLALSYHALRPTTTLYDTPDGKPVDHHRDQLVEKLYNDVLDRVSDYKFKVPQTKIAEGDRDLIEQGRDAAGECTKTMSEVEDSAPPASDGTSKFSSTTGSDLVPISSDRLTGKAHLKPGVPAAHKAAFKARMIGWQLKNGVRIEHDIDLTQAANAKPLATLGSVMDDAIHQYRTIVDLTPLDFRLMNWHIANLEYSNAINYKFLSLRGWDLDAGNEWEGKHTMVTGGFQQVPRGLLNCPSPLDVRKNKVVKAITHSINAPGSLAGRVEFEDGDVVEADYIVSTLPLGVLKWEPIKIQPAFPDWKAGAIARLGFGVLNKVVLVYDHVFWDENRDIFGILREPVNNMFSLDQKDYSPKRGRFFQWFNCTKSSGVPTLIALMAGDAAFQTQASNNSSLVKEATEILRTTFGKHVPNPVEAIITRWGYDRFARGSYSYAGPDLHADDYDTMAKTVGNLFFAGEHTCATHPATVHGAYISGLRVASDVLESMIGPIDVPTPLILPRDSLKRKASEMLAKDSKQARLEAYEEEVWKAMHAALGDIPWKPQKISANPYILFSKDNYDLGRKLCEEGRRPGKGGKAMPNEVRVMLAKMWKDTTPEQRKPYDDKAAEQKKSYVAALAEFQEKSAKWDIAATAFRIQYEKDHPSVPGPDEEEENLDASFSRRVKRPSTYAEEESGSDSEDLQ